ncbi:hypothetical protein RCDURKIN_55 [Rhodobacter phage RcDurkin]|nr:hypothetical protein RCDURKIN_55 [Rhodobacter phage RcDurkin]QXN72525.1 hypothetical protein RCTIPTONUS_55 [Rhodobacter phage RcTiptonus]UUV43799.1 hypothetical protein RCKICKAPOO_58 [Rhodobacter phage RcKickapoo]UUV44426.1 hypothetical protein RCMENCHIE_57 [Rhodobacter phage RcMenchie]
MELSNTGWTDIGQGATLTVQNRGGAAIYVRMAATAPDPDEHGGVDDFMVLPGQWATFHGLTDAGVNAYARQRGYGGDGVAAVAVFAS